MPKKSDRENRLKEICDAINKGAFGGENHDAVTYVGSGEVSVLERFSSGCSALDDALGGGWPKGRQIEIYGPESSGKTTIALQAAANYQKKYPDDDVALIDAEYSQDEEYAKALGVDMRYFLINQPESGEQALNVLSQLIQNGVKLIIVDSVAALVPKSELEGDVGEGSGMAEQARIMSKALRRITTEAGSRDVTIIWTNQMREKIGVCFEYHTPVLLADGTTEWIGKIVNQRIKKEVMSYNADTGLLVPRKIKKWVHNGSLPKGEKFVRIRVHGVFGKGKGGIRNITATKSHRIFTPDGEKPAGDIRVGDVVLVNDWQYFTPEHHELILGSILGDGSLRFEKGSPRGHLRFLHGPKQYEYCEWKASCFGILTHNGNHGVVWFDTMRAQELEKYREIGKKKAIRYFPLSLIPSITPKVVAIWYQDDGTYSGSHKRWGWGKCSISAKCLSRDTLEAIALHLQRLGMGLATVREGKGLEWNGHNSHMFQQAIAPFVHPAMRYKIKKGLPPFSWNLEPMLPILRGYDRRVTRVGLWSPPPRRRSLFDLEIEGHHSYVAGGIIVHNTYGDKTTTPAGRALKHYASVRVKVDRIGTVKEKIDGEDVAVCIRTKADVRKNKTAPPFKTAEFYITFGHGIDTIAAILDGALARKVVLKRGAWFSFGDEQLGQGRMDTLTRMRQDQGLCERISAATEDAKAKGVVAEPDSQKFQFKRPKTDTRRVPVTDPDSLDASDEPAESGEKEGDGTQVTDV